MPRKLCLPTLPFSWYYFHRKAIYGREIFRTPSEMHALRSILLATLAHAGAHLHFAHLDDGNLHLVVQSGEGSLTEVLGAFCQQYARRVNRHRNEKGPLFRPHARLLLVQEERWLLPLGRFIHWIPRLRLASPERTTSYWNTDSDYRDRRRRVGLVTNLTFRRLSRRSPKPGVQEEAYRAFFDPGPTKEDIELFRRETAEDARILGDSMFVSETLRRVGLPARPEVLPASDVQEEIRRATLRLIGGFRVICNERLPARQARVWTRLTTLENVCSKWRVPPLPMIRGLSASYVVANRIASLGQAERLFCCRPKTLSAVRRRHYEQRFRDLFNQSSEELFQV
jgi:hypothetical protein